MTVCAYMSEGSAGIDSQVTKQKTNSAGKFFFAVQKFKQESDLIYPVNIRDKS